MSIVLGVDNLNLRKLYRFDAEKLQADLKELVVNKKILFYF